MEPERRKGKTITGTSPERWEAIGQLRPWVCREGGEKKTWLKEKCPARMSTSLGEKTVKDGKRGAGREARGVGGD